MHNIHFLLGTESHLDESVTNSEVAISKSCTFTNRKDRKFMMAEYLFWLKN